MTMFDQLFGLRRLMFFIFLKWQYVFVLVVIINRDGWPSLRCNPITEIFWYNSKHSFD